MVTDYPQRLTATTDMQEREAPTVLTRVLARVSQAFCGFRGHDSVLHFEGNRVMMRYASCGHDSPGWEITGRGPRKRYDGDARRHALVAPHLVLRKSA